MRRCAAIVMLFAFTMAAPLWGQMRGCAPGVRFVGSMPAGSIRGGLGLGQRSHFAEHGFNSGLFLGTPWLADYTAVPQSAPPTVIIVEPSSAAAEPREESKPVTPLLIELRGDHYVRFSGAEKASGAESVQPDYAQPSGAIKLEHNTLPAVADLPSAVLVFRDGHREEVRDYTIAQGILYAQGEYWTDGYWNKKIELSWLDMPETMKTNRTRGVNFRLPSGPNEVITRP